MGLLVKLEDGRKYFFPGSEPEDGMLLAKMALTDGELDHPNTGIEFGERSGDGGELWVSSKTVKASALTPTES